MLASVGKFANLMQQNVRASEERRNSVSIDCYGRISLKKVGSGVLERISDISRLGNRSVRVSDFYLQKLRFSALSGPNQQKFCIFLT